MKRASVELKTKILEAARGRSRWSDSADQDILNDDRFWHYLGDLFSEVEQGQKALAL